MNFPVPGRPALIAGFLVTTTFTGWSAPTLLDRSPFVPAGFDPSAQTAANTPVQTSATGYEFRGVYQIGDRYWFLISDPASQDGNWIELGKSSEELLVRSYDPVTSSLTLVSNNTEHKLELASVDANPTPIPVKGLVKATTRTPTKAPTPVRRTIRPTSDSPQSVIDSQNEPRQSTPPPAWLEKLRAEAAERRARGQQVQDDDASERRRSITPNRPVRPDADTEQPGDLSNPKRVNDRSR